MRDVGVPLTAHAAPQAKGPKAKVQFAPEIQAVEMSETDFAEEEEGGADMHTQSSQFDAHFVEQAPWYDIRVWFAVFVFSCLPLPLAMLCLFLYGRCLFFWMCFLFCRLFASSDGEYCVAPTWRSLCFWTVFLAYIIHVQFSKAPLDGSYFSPWVRRWSVLHHFMRYFPVNLVVDRSMKDGLDPKDGPYIFGYHPHGFFPWGMLVAFGSEACGFSMSIGKRGVRPRVVTLPVMFKTFVLREVALAMGCVTSDRATFKNILVKSNGNDAMIVAVGGAEETFYAQKSTYNFTLLKRKGFIRQALLAGGSIVPCIGFGETDTYNVSEVVNTFFLWVKLKTGIALPRFQGRWGPYCPIPFNMALTVVVGPAINMPKMGEGFDIFSQDGKDLVDGLHEDYLLGVRKLWARHRHELAKTSRGTLMFQGTNWKETFHSFRHRLSRANSVFASAANAT